MGGLFMKIRLILFSSALLLGCGLAIAQPLDTAQAPASPYDLTTSGPDSYYYAGSGAMTSVRSDLGYYYPIRVKGSSYRCFSHLLSRNDQLAGIDVLAIHVDNGGNGRNLMSLYCYPAERFGNQMGVVQ